MKATLSSVDFEEAAIAAIEVGALSVGPTEIGSMVLSGTHLVLSTDAGLLRNVRITVTSTASWAGKVSVSVPLVGDFGWQARLISARLRSRWASETSAFRDWRISLRITPPPPPTT